jgi:hypothetical protein
MDDVSWVAGFKSSLFIIVFGFVFIALFWQLRSVEKTIKERKDKEASEAGSSDA